MKVFVTGGTGFIGSHLVRQLAYQGDEVVCLIRSSSRLHALEDLRIKFVKGDLSDLESIRNGMSGCRVVYHCAADYRLWCKDPKQMYAANVEGTSNLLQVAMEKSVDRVIYTSTVGCLGLHRDGKPADESTPVRAGEMIGHYKRSKFLAEREAEKWIERGLPIVIVNPSTPIGDQDSKPTPTGKMVVDFLNGKMFGYVESGLNVIDVADVAAGHILAAQKGKTGEKYILGNRNLTLKEIFDLLSKISGVKSPAGKIPHWVAETYAVFENFWSVNIQKHEPVVPREGVKMSRHKMWFDSAKAVRELGLKQSPIEDALAREVKWFREHGYTQS